jgi:photosystem II stability/assembly factor-like uncharacterized protein
MNGSWEDVEGVRRWFRYQLLFVWGFFLVAGVFFFVFWHRHNQKLSQSAEPFVTCEKALSSENKIRIVARYDHTQFLTGATYTFYASQDGGKSWTETYRFRWDDPNDPECDHLRSLDAQTAWTWMFGQAFFTHDGGMTWSVWCPADTWPTSDCHWARIEDIRFDGAWTGSMILDPRFDCSVTVLRTHDGGESWHEGQE